MAQQKDRLYKGYHNLKKYFEYSQYCCHGNGKTDNFGVFLRHYGYKNIKYETCVTLPTDRLCSHNNFKLLFDLLR